MQQRSLVATSKISAEYSIASGTWTNITGLVVTAPEDGVYDICYSLVVYNDTAGDTSFIRIAINGNAISGTEVESKTTADTSYIPFVGAIDVVALKASDVVSIQAREGATSVKVSYAAGLNEAFIRIIKRGV
jgi:hypothetical protein